MRNMSFMHTADHIRSRTKTVTRRLGWSFLKAGDLVMACDKTRGVKAGQIRTICPIKIISVTKVPLTPMSPEELSREGFPQMTEAEFVQLFFGINKGTGMCHVNRIEFTYDLGDSHDYSRL